MQFDDTIDIVLPYVNPTDRDWQTDFVKYKQLAGDKSDNRFRDAGTLPHWFRLIRKHCNFKYRIVLILAQETQVPQWLNLEVQDLCVVYHRDFIPHSELPTFNSSVINCYVPFIPGLHERYILFNDDMFMIQPTIETDWFNGFRPKFHSDIVKYPRGNKLWDVNIGNSQRVINELLHCQVFNVPEHSPLPHRRTVDLFLWSKIGQQMQDALSDSRFRREKNITDWIFSMYYAAAQFGDISPYPISTYFNTERISLPGSKIACYNDTEAIQNYTNYKKKLHKILLNVGE